MKTLTFYQYISFLLSHLPTDVNSVYDHFIENILKNSERIKKISIQNSTLTIELQSGLKIQFQHQSYKKDFDMRTVMIYNKENISLRKPFPQQRNQFRPSKKTIWKLIQLLNRFQISYFE